MIILIIVLNWILMLVLAIGIPVGLDLYWPYGFGCGMFFGIVGGFTQRIFVNWYLDYLEYKDIDKACKAIQDIHTPSEEELEDLFRREK